LKGSQQQLQQISLTEFRERYPTPGALALALEPNSKQTPALEAVDAALVEVRDAPDDLGRQMIFMPPQEGKSTRTSCWFPLWMLAQNPGLRIGIVSYAAGKAARWGRWLRRMIARYGAEWDLELMPDSRASDKFETTKGGQVICVGLEGGLTGEPVDLLIIDDPVRGRAEAESSTYREAAWDWWESNAATRGSASFKVVFMMTRWHADDLAGRLLDREAGRWKVLRIPAVREPGKQPVRGSDGASVYNPHGELVSVQKRRVGYYREMETTRSMYVWNSIYMQQPVAAEGNLFPRADFRYWRKLAADPTRHDETGGQRLLFGDDLRIYVSDMRRFITMDLAASTKTSADWTVACAWGITADGWLVLLDRARHRIAEGAHWAMVKPMTKVWGIQDVYVEKGFIGTTLVIDGTNAGIRIRPLTPEHDKVTRAIPASDRVRAHTVFFPADVPWLDEWCDEIAGFPQWAHDDQTDNLSYAGRVHAAHWAAPPPDRTPADPSTGRDLYGIPDAIDVALGRRVDLNRAEW
jgi:predicted phage terminase large subunit-like protein